MSQQFTDKLDEFIGALRQAADVLGSATPGVRDPKANDAYERLVMAKMPFNHGLADEWTFFGRGAGIDVKAFDAKFEVLTKLLEEAERGEDAFLGFTDAGKVASYLTECADRLDAAKEPEPGAPRP